MKHLCESTYSSDNIYDERKWFEFVSSYFTSEEWHRLMIEKSVTGKPSHAFSALTDVPDPDSDYVIYTHCIDSVGEMATDLISAEIGNYGVIELRSGNQTITTNDY